MMCHTTQKRQPAAMMWRNSFDYQFGVNYLEILNDASAMVSNKYNESLVEGIPTPKVFHEF